MPDRREFLDVVVKGAGMVYLSGLSPSAWTQEAPSTPTKAGLMGTLEAVGKPTRLVKTPDGTEVLLLPYGGRVLGLYAPGSDENFYWTHPALRSQETAKAFYESEAWHNSGGDRTWLAPEVDIFLPKFPDTSTYWQPRALDPGKYQVVESERGLCLENKLSLTLSRSGKEVLLSIAKSIGPAPNPLRYEKGLDLAGVQYAGYTQSTRLAFRDPTAKDMPDIGLWNLVQMPHAGELLIPTYAKSEPKVWFGQISPEDLVVGDRLVRYRMRAQGEHKLGVRAVATTGRVGYLSRDGKTAALIVRNFQVNPSGEYVDVPWKDPKDLGYSTQACNVNSSLGAFSELEYHIPAIGRSSGVSSCDDAAQVWAFRGPEGLVLALARRLLSPEV